MRKLLTLIVLVFMSATFFGQAPKESGVYERTFVKDVQHQPNAQYQANLRNDAKWKNFKLEYGDWWVQFNERTGLPLLAAGPPIQLHSSNPQAAVSEFLKNALRAYNFPVDELVHARTYQQGKYKYVVFKQVVDGKEVLWSEAKFQLTTDHQLVHFNLDVYPSVEVPAAGGMAESAIASQAAKGLNGLKVEQVREEEPTYILPVVNEANKYEFRPVKKVFVHARSEGSTPSKFLTLVDANTGDIHYRQDQYHSCVPSSGVADVAFRDSVVLTPLEEKYEADLPHMRVEVNDSVYHTDENGNLNLPNLTEPVEATFYLKGKYATVVDAGPDSTFSITDTIYPGSNTIRLDEAKLTEINGYYHTNVVHDHMKEFLPTDFVALDTSMAVNVDIGTGSCNAFFDGSLNFFSAGPECPPTALFGDVVYHEYGHGINFTYYNHLGEDFTNGALGEGYSDVWAFSITEDPIIGKGFLGGSETFVRRYDEDPKVYPQDLVGQTHSDGEIIAGAFWDLYRNLGDMDKMTELFVGAHNTTPMAPTGSEGQLYREVLLQVLFTDDDDNDITNGTPNDSLIIDAFGKHGITLLLNATVAHEPMVLTKDTLQNTMRADVTTAFDNFLDDVVMTYKVGDTGQWNEVTLTNTGTNVYEGDFPPLSKGDIVQYYFSVNDIFEYSGATNPEEVDLPDDSNLPYFLLVGYNEYVNHDFDNVFFDWQVDPDNDDDAATGNWEFGRPTPSFSEGVMVQPDVDRTVNNDNNFCAFTGNAQTASSPLGQNDVDDGKTTLQSPPLDLTKYENPVIAYWRWFINDPPTGANPGNDPWQVFISDDGENWQRIERTFVSDASWRQNVVKVSDYVDLTSSVFLRFVAQDSIIPGANLEGGSIVEAAVDDLQIFAFDETGGVGIESEETKELFVYPSPASDVIHIRDGTGQMEHIKLYDAQGREVLHKTSANGNHEAISVAGLESGLYLIQVETDQGSVTRKVVVQH